jgi:hypothetical protein
MPKHITIRQEHEARSRPICGGGRDDLAHLYDNPDDPCITCMDAVHLAQQVDRLGQVFGYDESFRALDRITGCREILDAARRRFDLGGQ